MSINGEEKRNYLGFCGYYRRFCKAFSKIAKLLAELMTTSEKKGKRTNTNHHTCRQNIC